MSASSAYFRRIAISKKGRTRIEKTLMVEIYPFCALNARFVRMSRRDRSAAREAAERSEAA